MMERKLSRIIWLSWLALVAGSVLPVEEGTNGWLSFAQDKTTSKVAAKKAEAKPRKSKAFSKAEEKALRQDLPLTVGRTFTLDITFVPCGPLEKCILVANGTLLGVEFTEQKKQLVFTPAKKGETTVTVRDEKGDIRVIYDVIITDTNLDRRVSELRELLRDIEGIEIKPMGDKIVIDGEVVVISDLSRLYAVLSDESYKGLVLNLVTVSPIGMQIMADKMKAEINKPDVNVRVLNGYFVLEGRVENADEREQAALIAKSMLQGIVLPSYNTDVRTPIDLQRPAVKDPIINRIATAPPKPRPADKMIRLTFDFVELSKDYLRSFGFSWIPSLDSGGSISFGQSTTGGVTSSGNGSLSGTIGNLFPKLTSAQEAGYARVLEESIMIVKAGQEAKFTRKLEIPIQTVDNRGQVDYKQKAIGPQIKARPAIVGQTEDIDMSIEFSYTGYAGKAGNAPITLDHTYNTTVVVKSGESAAVVNAMSNAISTGFNKDKPGGTQAQNPLFALLRSKAFQKSKSQFVVFITPQILETAQGGTEDIKQKYGMKRKMQ